MANNDLALATGPSGCIQQLRTDTPFYISANELNVSSEHPDAWVLYRVYGLSENADRVQLFELAGLVA